MSTDYRPTESEPRWQRRWDDARAFEARDPATDPRPRFYVLEMLPYPSGRIHVGHVRNYVMGDVVARFKRMRGFNVFHPIGWDSLGLPAENAALEHGTPAREWTIRNIAAMKRQLQRLGLSYDWSCEIASHEPEYYRWNQWTFLRFLEKGLAYRKRRAVHWCSSCHTVLANEQVEDGACERCGTSVEARELEQWFFRTTQYQDELLSALDTLEGWPEGLRRRQKNWIGRSEGVHVGFPVVGRDAEVVVFTTRLDTIHGCTSVVVAPDHPLIEKLGLPPSLRERLADFARDVAKAHVSERGELTKEGLDLGVAAMNPYTGRAVPVWAGNFVVKDYGTGAVMSVPAHDLRDLDFARRHGLPIVPVIRPADAAEALVGLTEDGILAGTGTHDGETSEQARATLLEEGRRAGVAEAAVQFRLRDWGVSRQRYWGTPIPIVHCAACGVVPVPDDELPVRLPDQIELTRESSPLARHPDFASTRCPRCGGKARRESDTMDTFVDSSWYFVRYLDPRCTTAPFRPEVVAPWLPVDLYIGGPEHAVGHLIYCRWWMRALRAIGLDVPAEPVRQLIHHGMVTAPTRRCPTHDWRYAEEVREGRCIECGERVEIGPATKMSKRKRNGVEPDAYVERYGADTLRLYSMFSAPPGQELEWSDDAVEGMYRFLRRLHRMATRDGLREADAAAPATSDAARKLESSLHRTIHRVTVDLDQRLHFNTAISTVMELFNAAQDVAPIEHPLPEGDAGTIRRVVEGALVLLSPFAPHACEELWAFLGHETLLTAEAWPQADESRLIDDTAALAVQVNGKLRGQITVPRDATQEQALAAAHADPNVARHLEGHAVVKIVHVPNRLLNIVVRSG
jgi:leucyl-tRNA synthetase